MKRKTWPSLEEWVESETELKRKITELYESELSPEEQARKSLNYLLNTYDLPLTPMDVEGREWEDAGDSWYLPISMLEQVAQLKFVEPDNNDPRYLVLNAAYLIHHKLIIDLSQELGEFLVEDELQGLGYRGEDILEAELIPVKKGESWFELGCTYFTKEMV
ncbi:hypothetical protein [Algoriphagus sp.]|jgi:hypothetical protein|uniref:hypothetical protein n=1 Tax=Algoriphagus sp. TaxID=1872435 RepID=UPI002720F86F|nr:hypothetical protein [Algoriphagus sp.]MDO8965685.1 hypothetical protein [Algoriphagus sp.]MDP3199053.1 hypothetical protein [Algoriphagus sp.]